MLRADADTGGAAVPADQPLVLQPWVADDDDLEAELVALRDEVASANAEVERLREHVRVLESWLEAASRQRQVEYVQSQRLALMRAVERDRRFLFVFSLPVALLILYCAGLVVLVWLLLEGRL
jgi:hypothetical protein